MQTLEENTTTENEKNLAPCEVILDFCHQLTKKEINRTWYWCSKDIVELNMLYFAEYYVFKQKQTK